ncbi:uncharacterized protein LOC128163687 isoform X2 [Crassostrea angulata]|uniref:uncharacterized protein LOC128163687 isoform X2 n=1 Tax=Magallana angulata TaxID=2784310 RepID=UPI0022B151BF|nr:uncharacterized protein LOC128163687 isoform X2 [Crassostrea angulata]
MSAVTIALLTFLCLFLIGGQGHDQVSANDVSKRNVNLNGIKNFLLKEIRRKIPKNIKGKSGNVIYTLSKVKINKLQLPKSDLRIKRFNPLTVEWTARNGEIKGEMNWWYRYYLWRDKGHVSFSTKRIGFSVTAVLGNRIRVRNCSSNPPSVHLRIRGRLWSWIYRPLNKALKRVFRKRIAGSNGLLRHLFNTSYDRESLNLILIFVCIFLFISNK